MIEDQLDILVQENKTLSNERNHFQKLCDDFESKLEVKNKDFVSTDIDSTNILKDNNLYQIMVKYKEVHIYLTKIYERL